MTDCGCDKAKAELEEYLHRELADDDARDVSEHLENCADCSGEELVGLTLTEKVRAACQETAPAELRASILATLDERTGLNRIGRRLSPGLSAALDQRSARGAALRRAGRGRRGCRARDDAERRVPAGARQSRG